MTMTLLAAGENPLIPPRDEFGLPGWLWLFHLLLPFTFALHVIFMNFALGGSIIIPLLWALGWRGGRAELNEVTRAALRIMPIAISFTITTGVAVLLFVQVVYGQFFYTANILMGWHWLAILLYLMLGFYMTYAADRLMQSGRTGWGILVLVIVAGAFLTIAHVFNNNAILSLRPGQWNSVYDGTSGVHARDPMWTPRYLHSVIGSIAVTGLWIAALGRLTRTLSQAARRTAVTSGLWIVLIATAFQIFVGVWFFVSLESATQRAMFDFADPRAILWMLGAVAGVSSIGFIWHGIQRPDNARAVWLPIALIGFVVIGMSAGREAVRINVLSRVPGALYQPSDVRVQSGSLALFLVTLVIGLATVALMLRWVWASNRSSTAVTP